MFATHDHARIAMAGFPAAVGRHYWSQIEVPLFVPYLMVTYKPEPGREDDCQGAATELLGSVEDLVASTYWAARNSMVIDNVCLICPAHMCGQKHWGLYPLTGISIAFEPDAREQVAYVYETTEGKMVSSLLSTPAEKLVRAKRLFTFKDPSLSALTS